MANCTTTPFSFDVQYFYDNSCFTCNEECGTNISNAKCVAYTGPNLACSGIETDDSLETALQKIDEQICTATGDYSSYQFNCLTEWLGEDITTEGEFVDAITLYACEITENLESFTGTTFPSYQSSVAARFTAIEGPGITCTIAGVTSTDDLETILTKFCTTFGDLNDSVSLTGVDWDQCFTVTTPPTTIAEAFSLVIDQICQVEAAGASLPTFNNSANCLAGTSTDSLVTTIDSIIDVLCETNPFDATAITFGCVPTAADLQDVVQNVVTEVSELMQDTITWSADFVVTQTNGSDPCAGVTVELATPINQDRFVAVDVSDSSPGTLTDKITAGTGITITNNGTDIEISASGTADSFEVKAKSTGSEGYLEDKLAGGAVTGLSITTAYNGGTDKIDISPSIDATALFTLLLNQLELDEDLYTLFCEKVANCPSPCDAPTDVQAVPVNTTSTTTILP